MARMMGSWNSRLCAASAALLVASFGCASTPTVQEEREMAKRIEREARQQFGSTFVA